jgi:DNA-binding transcriptional LysR family regulator
VALTPAGSALVADARALLERADDLQRRARRLAGSEPVRLGYVNWLPPDLSARTAAVAPVRVDTWVAPSHVQAARVADGSLDLAVCWVTAGELEQHGVDARLIGADRLYAVAVGDNAADVAARDTLVLLDEDATSWSSWNAYAEELARATGARPVRISDGGITGAAFFDHVRRSRRPVINSPKGQADPLPPDLVRRPVVAPPVYWTWSLVWRRSETRASVLAVVDALSDVLGEGDSPIHDPDGWLPEGDPYRR